MNEYIFIGSVPYDEECAQVGADNYAEQSRKESKAYVEQLWRILKEKRGIEKPVEGFDIVVKNEYHDFGTYKEVAVKFDYDNDEAVKLAYEVEGELTPANWDEVAKQQLGLA